MLRPTRKTVPVGELVSLNQMKAHAVVDFPDDDLLLRELVDAAIDHLDGYDGILGRCILNQVWEQPLGAWPACGVIRLPFPEVKDVAISYLDADNVSRDLDAGEFHFADDVFGGFVMFNDGFSGPDLKANWLTPITVEFTCGMGSDKDVPSGIKTAIKLLVAHWYENREGMEAQAGLPASVERLISPYRRISV